jgi:hypothetical protein
MKKLLKATSAMVMGLSFLAPLPTMAGDYTQKFAGTTTGSGTVNLDTPTTQTLDVVSKYNQPRIVPTGFTNPHQGTDIAAPYGTPVYSIARGWVTYVSSSECEVDIQLDINRDGIRNDNTYVRYDHLSNIFVNVGDFVTTVTAIANSGNENGKVGPHLHFGVMKQDSANTGRPDYWVRNEPFYRSTPFEWDNGKKLDFISYSTWDGGKTASFYTYAYDDTYGYGAINSGDAVVFHRKSSTNAWAIKNATYGGGVNRYYADLSTIYPVGTQVDWMVRVIRSNIKNNANANYTWAFHNAKFAQPDFDPNSTSNQFDYFTNTRQ